MSNPRTCRNPIPERDMPSAEATTSKPPTSNSTGTATPDDHIMQEGTASRDGAWSGIVEGLNEIAAPPSLPAAEPANFDQIVAAFEGSRNQNVPAVESSSAPSADVIEPQRKLITVDDLNDERAMVRGMLYYPYQFGTFSRRGA